MLLDVQGITKIFKGPKNSKVVANDNLNFSLKEGEIFGLLGHNGAGKTTLINQIIGTLTPTSGEINLMGKSVEKSPTRARKLCSVQPQSQLPLGFLTPAQAVMTMGQMRLGNKRDIKKRMDMLFEKLDIGRWANTEGIKLSGGIRRLTAFCMAVINPGKLVILDEPTNDVDPTRRRYLWDVIRELTNDGTSVILVTHNVLEAEKAVNRVAILHKGKFIALGTPSEIKKSVDDHIRVDVNMIQQISASDIPSWVLNTHHTGSRMNFSIKSNAVSETIEWLRHLAEQGEILDYALTPSTLEDVYVELTGEKDAGSKDESDAEKDVFLV